jgi:hypothetical protein
MQGDIRAVRAPPRRLAGQLARAAMLALVLAGAAAAAAPATEPAGQSFAALGAELRMLLAPFESHWPRLRPVQQQALLDNAARWQRLDPIAQARVLDRLGQWLALPADARQQLRDRHAVFGSLPAAEQQALRRRAAIIATMTDEERLALRSRFAGLREEQRRALLTDATRRDVAELAQRVFAFVPADARAETLAMIEALDPDERERLQQIARRQAPWQREALRLELLRLPPEQRGRHLRDGAG